MMKIYTDRLIIRRFTNNDADMIYELSKETTLAKWIPDQVYADIDEARKTLGYLISQYDKNTFPYIMAVEEKSSGRLIGHVGLSKIKQGIEIGYAIGMSHQGKGYAKETVKAYSDWAKANFNLKQIYGIVDKKNSASCSVLKGTGFKFILEDIKGEFGSPGIKMVYIK